MPAELDQFEDPQLKAAVCRCWGNHKAPAELRDRVSKMCSRQRMLRSNWTRFAVSMAAVLAILLGIGVFNHRDRETDRVGISLALGNNLINTHDRCCSLPDHHGLAPAPAGDAVVAAAMQKELARPVLMARPTDPGWTFRGASICHVGDTKSGHLVFVHGSDSVSVFSLPRELAPDIKEGQQFASIDPKHTIVGFVKDGALFCLVGSGPGAEVGVDHLRQLRDQMESQVTTVAQIRPATNGVELIQLASR